MGYFCTAEGTMKLKKNADIKAVEKIFTDWYEMNDGSWGREANTIWLYLNDKYRNDEIEDLLYKTIPFIKSGEICYCGEDGALWRHKFINKKKTWVEQDGHVVYSNNSNPFAKQITDCPA